jgi:hypothetical protein
MTFQTLNAVYKTRCETCNGHVTARCYFWVGKTKRHFCSRRCYYLRGPKQKPTTTVLTFTDTETLNLSESSKYDK